MTDIRQGDEDLIWTAEAIAKVIGRPVAATYHMLETGQLAANKKGGRWVASRRKLLADVLGEAA